MSSGHRLLRRRDPPVPAWERLDELEEYRELFRVRLEHVVGVREPLVLVSQIQRSGGTLLSQLFDGHPECHAHPHELKIGSPRKFNWPLDLTRPERCFETLFEKRSVEYFPRRLPQESSLRNAYDASLSSSSLRALAPSAEGRFRCLSGGQAA